MLYYVSERVLFCVSERLLYCVNEGVGTVPCEWMSTVSCKWKCQWKSTVPCEWKSTYCAVWVKEYCTVWVKETVPCDWECTVGTVWMQDSTKSQHSNKAVGTQLFWVHWKLWGIKYLPMHQSIGSFHLSLYIPMYVRYVHGICKFSLVLSKLHQSSYMSSLLQYSCYSIVSK